MTTTAAVKPKPPTLTEKYNKLNETLSAVQDEYGRVVESLSAAVMSLRQEDIGWAAPSSGAGYRGLSIEDLKHWSAQIRASLSGTHDNAPNPHMRNGIMLRHSFIWDGGIHYSDVPGDSTQGNTRGKANVQKLIDDVNNDRLFFSSSARRRREHALFSDGLYVVVGDNGTKKLRPIPLSEITATFRDELYEDEIVAYRWTRNEATRTRSGGQSVLTGDRQAKSYWVYVDWFDGRKPDQINYEGQLEEVLKDKTIFDLHANRPDGAAFGSPDAISALVWARIVRDLIMNGVKMQDALALFAYKVKNPTRSGQQNSGIELAKPNQSGSAANLGGENDISTLASAGKGYDFGSIGFLVSTMAASLHVSGIALSANTALAGSSYGAAKTLDLPGRMAMETRRREHIEFDKRVLRWMGAPNATIYFDNFDDSTDEFRAVQALMLLWTSGNLTPEGFQAEVERIYGYKLVGGAPKGVIVPNNQKQVDDAAKAAADAAEASGAVTQPSASQGKNSAAGNAGHASDMPQPGKSKS